MYIYRILKILFCSYLLKIIYCNYIVRNCSAPISTGKWQMRSLKLVVFLTRCWWCLLQLERAWAWAEDMRCCTGGWWTRSSWRALTPQRTFRPCRRASLSTSETLPPRPCASSASTSSRPTSTSTRSATIPFDFNFNKIVVSLWITFWQSLSTFFG